MSGNSAILVAPPKGTGRRGLIHPLATRSWRRSKSGTFSVDGFDVAASFDAKRSLKAFDPVLELASVSRGQGTRRRATSSNLQLKEAYDRCGELCAKDTNNFYLATLLMTPERRRALWALCVWCRRTDDLVDGPHASLLTPSALDQWERRLIDIFEGNPYDIYDVALYDTVSKFSIDIQHFRDLIKGMRLDTTKTRYENFDELWLYCYYVAATVGLICLPVMGIAPDSKATPESIYNSVVACGISNQLTNILRDVGEDARMGRIYLPLDELAAAGLSENDIFQGKVSDKWRAFIKSQIERAKVLFDEAEKGIPHLDSASRWPIMATSVIYRNILDAIEDNDYDNFTKRANVGKAKKLVLLSIAYARTFESSSSSNIQRR